MPYFSDVDRLISEDPCVGRELPIRTAEQYFQGGGSISSYKDYLSDAYGPSRILGDTLAKVFKPRHRARSWVRRRIYCQTPPRTSGSTHLDATYLAGLSKRLA